MAVNIDLRCQFSHHHIHHIIGGKTFVQCLDHFQHFHHIVLGFYFFFGVQTVVAITAIRRIPVLSKIMEQYFPAAYRTLGISYGLIYQLCPHFSFAQRFIAHQVLQLGNIFVRVIQYTEPFHTVSSGTAGFLVIVLYRLRNIKMDHIPDIRFIDPHPEGNGGHDHLYIFVQELVLPFGTQFLVKAGMVCHGFDLVGYQDLGQLFSGFTVQCINDPALAFMAGNEFDNAFDGLVFRDLGLDLIIEIRPVKRRKKNIRIAQAQVFNDIAFYFGRGRSG